MGRPLSDPAQKAEPEEQPTEQFRLDAKTYRYAISWLGAIVLIAMICYTAIYIGGSVGPGASTFFASAVSTPLGILGGILVTKGR